MEVKFYKNTSDKLNVSKDITLLSTYNNATLKDEGTLDNLSIIINDSWSNVADANYCYITELKRYYYIGNPVLLKGGRTEYPLSIDVLMSLKSQFLNTVQLIGRQEYESSEYQTDNLIPTNVNNEVTVLQFTEGSFNTNTATSSSRNFVLTVAGRN